MNVSNNFGKPFDFYNQFIQQQLNQASFNKMFPHIVGSSNLQA